MFTECMLNIFIILFFLMKNVELNCTRKTVLITRGYAIYLFIFHTYVIIIINSNYFIVL